MQVAARHVTDPQERQELTRRAGRLLAEQIVPQQLQLAMRSAAGQRIVECHPAHIDSFSSRPAVLPPATPT